MNKPELTQNEKDFIDKIIRHKSEDVKQTDQLLPMLFVGNSKTGEMGVVAMVFNDQESKVKISESVKKLCSQLQADSVLAVLESYALTGGIEIQEDFEKGLKEGKWKSVSEHPNAQEVVMFSYENRYGTWTGLGTIDKDRSKGITDEVEMKHIEQSTGILTNFINIKVLLGGADE